MLPLMLLHSHGFLSHHKDGTESDMFLQSLQPVLLSQMVSYSFSFSPSRILINSISFASAVLNSVTKFLCPE